VRVGDTLASPVNLAAAAAGLARSIAGWVPNFSAVAPILAGSDLLATLPELAMSETVHAYRLESAEVPFPLPALPHAMVWCSGRGRDRGLEWLRGHLRPIAKQNFAS
jgi:DNA-binding transcriptional LysR family regulator